MATIREYHCGSCGRRRRAGALLDLLLEVAEGRRQACRQCGGRQEIRIDFPFGLGASHSKCTILDCFHPKVLEKWRGPKGGRVTFYPFLVILKRHGRKNAVWLPYWHVVKGKNGHRKSKYGQWAPIMDLHLFESLLAQAHRRGYLNGKG